MLGSRKRWLGIIVLALVAAFAVAACGGDDSTTAEPAPAAADPEPAPWPTRSRHQPTQSRHQPIRSRHQPTQSRHHGRPRAGNGRSRRLSGRRRRRGRSHQGVPDERPLTGHRNDCGARSAWRRDRARDHRGTWRHPRLRTDDRHRRRAVRRQRPGAVPEELPRGDSVREVQLLLRPDQLGMHVRAARPDQGGRPVPLHGYRG